MGNDEVVNSVSDPASKRMRCGKADFPRLQNSHFALAFLSLFINADEIPLFLTSGLFRPSPQVSSKILAQTLG